MFDVVVVVLAAPLVLTCLYVVGNALFKIWAGGGMNKL